MLKKEERRSAQRVSHKREEGCLAKETHLVCEPHQCTKELGEMDLTLSEEEHIRIGRTSAFEGGSKGGWEERELETHSRQLSSPSEIHTIQRHARVHDQKGEPVPNKSGQSISQQLRERRNESSPRLSHHRRRLKQQLLLMIRVVGPTQINSRSASPPSHLVEVERGPPTHLA